MEIYPGRISTALIAYEMLKLGFVIEFIVHLDAGAAIQSAQAFIDEG